MLKCKIEKEEVEEAQKQLEEALDANESLRARLESSEVMQAELRGKLATVQSAYAEIFMVTSQKARNPLQRVASCDSSDIAIRKGRRASFDPDANISSTFRRPVSPRDEFARVTSAPGRVSSHSSSPRHFNSSPPTASPQSRSSVSPALGFSVSSPQKKRGSAVFSPSSPLSTTRTTPPPYEEPSSQAPLPASAAYNPVQRRGSSFSSSRECFPDTVPEGKIPSSFSADTVHTQSWTMTQQLNKTGTPRSAIRQSSTGQLYPIQPLGNISPIVSRDPLIANTHAVQPAGLKSSTSLRASFPIAAGSAARQVMSQASLDDEAGADGGARGGGRGGKNEPTTAEAITKVGTMINWSPIQESQRPQKGWADKGAGTSNEASLSVVCTLERTSSSDRKLARSEHKVSVRMVPINRAHQTSDREM